jgi:hypothetical protein
MFYIYIIWISNIPYTTLKKCHDDDPLSCLDSSVRTAEKTSLKSVLFANHANTKAREAAVLKREVYKLRRLPTLRQRKTISKISLSLFMVSSLCGLSMFETLNSVFNTCHFIKIFKSTTCFGLNRPSSGVKNCLSRKVLILGIHAPSSLCLLCACSLLFSCVLVTIKSESEIMMCDRKKMCNISKSLTHNRGIF